MRQKKIQIFTLYSLLIGIFAFVLPAEARASGVSLVAVPTTQTVTVGQTAAYTIKINRDNYTDKVTLAATGLPAGVTATFTPNTTTATSSTLKLQTLTTTPIGTFNINVKGTANGITIAPIVVKLITQPVPSISFSVNPSTQFIVSGQSTFYDIAISRFNYDGKITLSAQNLPSGVTALFEPESTYGNSSRMYLYSNGLPFISKDYSIAVRAFGDGIDKLTFILLRVNYGIVWATQFSVPNNQRDTAEIVNDVTYDSAGNVYLCGYTYNQAIADYDSWVAKLDAGGNQLWLRQISGLTQDYATHVFVDAAGNVYAAGNTLGNGQDIFIVRIDANAAQAPLVNIFSTLEEEGKGGMQFGVNTSGNTTLTAATRVISSNGTRDGTGEPTKAVNYDVTRIVFDANFTQTSTTVVNFASGNPKDVAVGSDGSIYVLSENLNRIGPGNFIFITSQVEKFNSPTGQNYFRQNIGPTSSDAFYATRLKVDSQGVAFAVGNKFLRQIDFKLYLSNPWIVKLDAGGTVVWQSEIGQFLQLPTEIKSLDITAAQDGDIFIAGATWGSLRGINPNAGMPPDPGMINASRTDAWFARFSGANGTQQFVSQFNVEDHDGFNAVKYKLGGTLYFAGYTLNFTNMRFGNYDALLLRCSTLYCGFTP
ncbi:MAG TPA: SBBP repeat-containing protein [Pyrinomonadaceae bacterium]|nr:SBBP repeat-containing protein [Pyrinomonadaceae bacterium]